VRISRGFRLIYYTLFGSWFGRFKICQRASRFTPNAMSLQKEYVQYISKRVVDELVKREMVEVRDVSALKGRILVVMGDELNIEDQINEEVRNLLKDYADEMRRTGVSYQEMFKVVKNKLVKDKKVVL
jgi:uncharacterized protein